MNSRPFQHKEGEVIKVNEETDFVSILGKEGRKVITKKRKTFVGQGMIPREIIDNLPHVDANDLKYEMRQYVQLHTTQSSTNTTAGRCVRAVVLGPRNVTGRHNFMSLETGMEINGRVVAELPITNAVIDRV